MAGVYVQVSSISSSHWLQIQLFLQSLQAQSATVKASSAEIRGKFKVSSQINLETVSAYV